MLLNSFEVWGSIVAVASAIHAVTTKSPSEAGFAITIACLTLAHRIGERPATALTRLRKAVRNSGGLLRGMMYVVAVGGTLLWFDVTFEGFDLLPAWADVWAKRLSPGLLSLAGVVAWGERLGSKADYVSQHLPDTTVDRSEICLYVALACLGLSAMLLSLGNPIELLLWSSQDQVQQAPIWRPSHARFLRVLVLSSLTWAVAFTVMLLSRIHQLTWSDAPRIAHGRGVSNVNTSAA
jgi:hypothetical protein